LKEFLRVQLKTIGVAGRVLLSSFNSTGGIVKVVAPAVGAFVLVLVLCVGVVCWRRSKFPKKRPTLDQSDGE
jgi:hypothetical protein